MQPALEQWCARLTTHSGLKLNLRPVSPDDEDRLAAFLESLAPEDLRFRFLAGIGKGGHETVETLVAVDHTLSEDFLAFDDANGSLVASAMLAAAPDMESAEAAIIVRTDCKGKGVGWTLLQYLTDYAKMRGIKRIETIESRENHAARIVESDLGFVARPFPGEGPLLILSKDLTEPEARLSGRAEQAK
jgi:acetyltransferase